MARWWHRAPAPPTVGRQALSWAGVLAAASAGLAFVPGFDVLSFHASLALAPLVAMAAGSVAVAAAHQSRREGASWNRATLRAFGAAGLLALVPLAGSLLSGLRAGPCDWVYGLAFYAAGPLASAALAVPAGLLAGLLVRGPRLASLAWSAAFLLSFAPALADLLRQPSIFAYAPFLGRYPGALYDTGLAVGAPDLAFRALCLALALSLWFLGATLAGPGLALRPDRRRRGWALAAASLGVAVALGLHGGDLGFRVTREDVRAELSGELASDACVIRFDPSLDPATARLLLEDCAFRVRRAEAFFGLPPGDPVRAYLYRDDGQKARLMGARRVEVAKPWLGEVHLAGALPGDPVLGHEVAHVVAGRLAPGPLAVPVRLGVVPDMARVEGLAVAAAFADDGPSPHEWALAMDLAGLPTGLEALFGPWAFLSAQPHRAYALAGSFVAYLAEVHGPEALRAVAAGRPFDEAAGAPLAVLEAGWRAHLADTVGPGLDPALPARAAGRFSGPGVLGHRCPVDVARLSDRAAAAAAAGDLPEAESCLREALRHDPSAAFLRRALARLRARAGDRQEAEALLSAGLAPGEDDLPPLRLSEAGDVAAALARLRGGDPPPEVADLWARAAAGLPPGGGEARSLAARLQALDLPPRARDAVLDLLWTGLPESADAVRLAAAEFPDDGLLRWLAGRLDAGAGRFGPAAGHVSAALALGLPGAPVPGDPDPFPAEAFKALGQAAYWAGDLPLARSALSEALSRAPHEGDRLLAEEYLARLSGR